MRENNCVKANLKTCFDLLFLTWFIRNVESPSDGRAHKAHKINKIKKLNTKKKKEK